MVRCDPKSRAVQLVTRCLFVALPPQAKDICAGTNVTVKSYLKDHPFKTSQAAKDVMVCPFRVHAYTPKTKDSGSCIKVSMSKDQTCLTHSFGCTSQAKVSTTALKRDVAFLAAVEGGGTKASLKALRKAASVAAGGGVVINDKTIYRVRAFCASEVPHGCSAHAPNPA